MTKDYPIKFDRAMNYYEIVLNLKKLQKRVQNLEDDIGILRAEVLSYFFSVDILKEYFIQCINRITFNKTQEYYLYDIDTVKEKLREIAKTQGKDLNEGLLVEDLLYFNIFNIDNIAKPFVSFGLANYYKCFNLELYNYIKVFFDIEHFVITNSFITDVLPEDKFAIGFLASSLNYAIGVAIIYIEHCFIKKYYNSEMLTQLQKKGVISKIKNSPHSDYLKSILKYIIKKPECKGKEILETLEGISESTFKRYLNEINEYYTGICSGELGGVKECIKDLTLVALDFE